MQKAAPTPTRRRLLDPATRRTRVKLIVSAEAAPGDLVRSGQMLLQFQRTASRLIEMQSREYSEAPKRAFGVLT